MSNVTDRYDLEVPPRLVLGPNSRPRDRSPEWGDVLLGMWSAAFSYFAMLFGVGFLFACVEIYSTSESWSGLLIYVTLGLMFWSIGALLLIILVVTPLGLIGLLVSSMLFRTLRTGARWPIVAGFAGGLTGFIPTALAFAAPQMSLGEYLLAILLGPIAATLFGQVGAAWISVGTNGSQPQESAPSDEDRPIRFDIRQLMIGTAWIAVALTLLKLTGMLTGGVLTIFTGWLLFQAVSLMVVVRVVERIRGSRRLSRISNPVGQVI